MKKLLGILLIVCLLTGIAAAGAFAEGASGDVEIWYYWETEGHQKALSHIIEEFNASQSAIKVSAKYVPFADFKKQLSIGAAADALPDLVILDNPDHAAYAAMGVFADITGKFDVSTYYPGPVNSCTLDGKLYGVPFGSNDLVLFYNEDMLAAAGCKVPTLRRRYQSPDAGEENGGRRRYDPGSHQLDPGRHDEPVHFRQPGHDD